MEISRRAFLASVSAVAIFASAVPMRFPRGNGSGGVWNRLPVGGGGYVIQTHFSADGITQVCTTDAGGALRSINGGVWDQVIDRGHMPAGEFDQTNALRAGGSYSIAVAPSDHTRVYLFCAGNGGLGRVYRSNDAALRPLERIFRPSTVSTAMSRPINSTARR